MTTLWRAYLFSEDCMLQGWNMTTKTTRCSARLGHRCIQGQGLGIVVWSLAKINYDASRVRHLLQAFAQEAVHRLNSAAHSSDASLKLGAQSLSNMLYAYALLNHHPGTQLLSAIAKGVQWQLRDFSPQVSIFQYNSPGLKPANLHRG